MTRSWRIALVGHCMSDASMLKSALRSIVPDAEFTSVTTDIELDNELDNADLLLVNRVLEGSFSNTAGIDLIDTILHNAPQARTMLISNFDDAQQQAVARGACRGFGKTTLRSPETRQRVLSALQMENS